MTIKQQGGVFGRNPTFNNIDVEGELTVGGSALPSGANTARLDTAQTFTANQTYKTTAADTDGITVRFENTDTSVSDNQSLGQIEWYGNDGSSGGTGVKGKIRTEAQAGSFGVTYDVVVSAGTQTGGSNLLRDVAKFTAGGNIVLPISGGGIDFSATAGTGTSELFDDYEEGTWTPTVIGLTVVGTPTYTGRYTKLGRLVNFDLRIEATTSTAATSGVTVFSLPFGQVGEPRSYAICSEGSPPTGPILTAYVYPPTWSATQSVWICGTYSV